MIINTDNAAYMKKAYKAVSRTLFPNSVHITCLAHIMNILGEDFKEPFKSVNKFVKDFNAIFWNAGARKAHYLNYLAEARPGEKPKIAPNPIGTRRNCWYDSVKYHVKSMDVYKTFISAEMDHAKSLAPNSLKDLAALFEDELDLQALKSQMLFIIDKSDIFVQATDMFQSQSPMALTVWSMLEGLQCSFGAGGVSLTSADRLFGCEMDRATKLQLLDLFNQAFAFVSAKLDKYLSPDGQPGIDFLKEVQIFHPAKIMFAPAACDLTTIVGLKSVPQEEIEHYIKFLAPQALRHASNSVSDIEMFWNSAVEVVPGLATCSRRYIYICHNFFRRCGAEFFFVQPYFISDIEKPE